MANNVFQRLSIKAVLLKKKENGLGGNQETQQIVLQTLTRDLGVTSDQLKPLKKLETGTFY